ncbi:hypothetical protein [Collimonas fungivorans]|uniref:hypothetical protein n=1 Tax=Collimonas fungivorans TaxID=158899 RepID=UPI000778246D|nr:hypothetical protein [Collimonas fungivorans]
MANLLGSDQQGGNLEAASWGVIGTVVGASASIATTAISNWNAFRLQKGANALERAERARAFQRENLLNAQEILQDLMRLMVRTHFADMAAYRETREWGKNILGDEISENTILSNRKISALIVRVADDALRGRLKDLHGKINAVSSAISKDQAERMYSNLPDVYESAMEHLGSVLRDNY